MYSSFAVVDREALCRRCRQALALGDVVVAVEESTFTFRSADGPWTHVRCAVDVSPGFAVELFRRDPLQCADRAELERLATDRYAAFVASSKTTRAALSAAGPTLEPTRDPLGRPRVQVLLTGNEAWIHGISYKDSHNTSVYSIVQDGLYPAVVSSLREYVFSPQASSVHVRMDPTQPIVASMLIMNMWTQPSPIYRQRVAEWVALDLPPPLLWLIGPLGDRQKVDDFVRQMRVFVERAGVKSDLCPVLLSQQITDQSVREVVAILDEHVAAVSGIGHERDAAVRAALLLQKIIDAEAEDALPAALTRAGRGVGRAHIAERTEVANVALKALKFRSHRAAILELIKATMVKLGPDILLAELQYMLADTSRRLGNDVALLVELLVYSGHAKLVLVALREKLTDKGLSKARRTAIEQALELKCLAAK